MGDFSGVLLTFVLLRTIKDGHTTNWQILAKSHYFLSMASQHSQLQTFKRTDIFPVSSFSESEMSSFCWSSTLQRCIDHGMLCFTSQYQIPLVYSVFGMNHIPQNAVSPIASPGASLATVDNEAAHLLSEAHPWELCRSHAARSTP